MAVYSLFYGCEVDAVNKTSLELAALRNESIAAFKSAIEAFSVHDNPRPDIRRKRIRYLMRFCAGGITAERSRVVFLIRHSDRAGIVPEFGEYMQRNWKCFFLANKGGAQFDVNESPRVF